MCNRLVNRKSKQIKMPDAKKYNKPFFQCNVYIKTSSAVPESCTQHLNMNKVYYLFVSFFLSLISLASCIWINISIFQKAIIIIVWYFYKTINYFFLFDFKQTNTFASLFLDEERLFRAKSNSYWRKYSVQLQGI